MKILKFGGKSLANGVGIQKVVDIITEKAKNGEQIAVVISARDTATNDLEKILGEAVKNNDNYKNLLNDFKEYQRIETLDSVEKEFVVLEKLFEGVSLLGNYSSRVKDQILAQGEIISGKIVTHLLSKNGVKANFTDSRDLIVTDEQFGEAQPIDEESRKKVRDHFQKFNKDTVNVVTGFIASTINKETTTLGRNGSNYTAALLANYLDAKELLNYSHVDGIYTADPDLISDAKKIDQLSYNEANELAYFGMSVLHAKTIIPLIEKEIPLRILNTFDPEGKGTLITSEPSRKGIKSISVLKNVALVNLEGRGLLGQAGVDARIFKALAYKNISVNIISQGSSERGIGLVVASENAEDAKIALENEFEADFYKKNVSTITVQDNVSVISIIGQDLSTFDKPYNALIRNQVVPILFNNTVSGRSVSLVVKKEELHKAVHVIHGQIFGILKKINLVIFGHGLVGGTLINQILKSAEEIGKRKKVALTIVGIANSRKVLLNEKGIQKDWKKKLENKGVPYTINDILNFADKHHLENVIAVDNTASQEFTKNYLELIKGGFDLVSSNKVANTLSFDFYKELRTTLEENQKQYFYETNVGAGLPLIDTIKLLHLSGENITRIKGVFSGSLSYLFNTFSKENRLFSQVLQEAINKGFTEPDPREDLCGNDVGRKLLILARELDLSNEFEDVQIHNLIPKELREGKASEFLNNLEKLNPIYQKMKEDQKPDHVLRYIGDLHGDLSQEKGVLEVKLVSVPKSSALGQVKGSDSIFEIYTESYGEQPIVIQGAGAGAAVTARGVFGDILRIAAP